MILGVKFWGEMKEKQPHKIQDETQLRSLCEKLLFLTAPRRIRKKEGGDIGDKSLHSILFQPPAVSPQFLLGIGFCFIFANLLKLNIQHYFCKFALFD